MSAKGHTPRAEVSNEPERAGRRYSMKRALRTAATALATLAALAATPAWATLPRGVARAFLDAGVPLANVAVVVREVGHPQPIFAHDADRPLNPASVMKLVTTFAALDLLGPDYRWKTEAYLGGRLSANGTLAGPDFSGA